MVLTFIVKGIWTACTILSIIIWHICIKNHYVLCIKPTPSLKGSEPSPERCLRDAQPVVAKLVLYHRGHDIVVLKTWKKPCIIQVPSNYYVCFWAKSKIGHHCDGRNFFSQLSFLSSQKPRHFMYITWINNHCTPQKHQ